MTDAVHLNLRRFVTLTDREATAVKLTLENMSKAARWAGGEIKHISIREANGKTHPPFWTLRLDKSSGSGLVFAREGEWVIQYDDDEDRKFWIYPAPIFRDFFVAL